MQSVESPWSLLTFQTRVAAKGAAAPVASCHRREVFARDAGARKTTVGLRAEGDGGDGQTDRQKDRQDVRPIYGVVREENAATARGQNLICRLFPSQKYTIKAEKL